MGRGVGRNGKDTVNKLNFKHLKFEVPVGHSGRTIQKISDHRSVELKRKVYTD